MTFNDAGIRNVFNQIQQMGALHISCGFIGFFITQVTQPRRDTGNLAGFTRD